MIRVICRKCDGRGYFCTSMGGAEQCGDCYGQGYTIGTADVPSAQVMHRFNPSPDLYYELAAELSGNIREGETPRDAIKRILREVQSAWFTVNRLMVEQEEAFRLVESLKTRLQQATANSAGRLEWDRLESTLIQAGAIPDHSGWAEKFVSLKLRDLEVSTCRIASLNNKIEDLEDALAKCKVVPEIS